jgi:hypothetical protein
MASRTSILDGVKQNEDMREFIRRLSLERSPSRSGAAAAAFRRKIADGRASAVLEGWEPDDTDELLLAMIADGRITSEEATDLAVALAKAL